MTGRILPIAEARLCSGEALIEQILLRREMQDKMVGQLYPGILEDEIATLRGLKPQGEAT